MPERTDLLVSGSGRLLVQLVYDDLGAVRGISAIEIKVQVGRDIGDIVTSDGHTENQTGKNLLMSMGCGMGCGMTYYRLAVLVFIRLVPS